MSRKRSRGGRFRSDDLIIGSSWPDLVRPSTSLAGSSKTWMPGTRPGMTTILIVRHGNRVKESACDLAAPTSGGVEPPPFGVGDFGEGIVTTCRHQRGIVEFVAANDGAGVAQDARR